MRNSITPKKRSSLTRIGKKIFRGIHDYIRDRDYYGQSVTLNYKG